MSSVIIFFAVMLFLFFWQMNKLKQQQQNKELIVFSLLWLATLIYGGLLIFEVITVTPFDWIVNLFN